MSSPLRKVTAEALEPNHRDVLFKAIRNVLATDIAEKTMSQLVDGIPEADFAWKSRGNFWTIHHPLYQHENLCEGVLEKTRALRDSFEPGTIQYNPNVLQAFGNSEVGSGDFELRLIELVAVAIHEIAVFLFNLQPKFHSQEYIDHVVQWQKPAGWSKGPWLRRWEEPLYPPRPTMFFHCRYLDVDLYPNGVADAAGYWAEDRIFGGVVLFGRGESGLECDGVYFLSGHKGETERVWRLLKSQVKALIDFFSRAGGEDKMPLTDHPLPMASSRLNMYRFDVWDAIAYHHVFRDPWERRIHETKPPERDVRSVSDYPELSEDLFEPASQALEVEETAEAADNVEVHRVPGLAEFEAGEVRTEDFVSVPITSSSATAEQVEKAKQRRLLEEKDIAHQRAPSPSGLDTSWIIKHGGVVGEPLAEKRLPYIGPPEGERPPKD